MLPRAPDAAPLLAGLLPQATALGGRWWDRASALLFAVIVGLVVATASDYGIIWDEWPHIDYGDWILRFYQSGLRQQQALTYRTNYFYGGGYDLIGAIFRRLVPLASEQAMHLLGGLVGALGLVGAWRLARRLAGPFAGFVAALLLALNPIYYGHMFNNPKDVPFAVAYVWSLDCIVALLADLPRPPRRRWIALTIAIGLAMSVRIAGVLLLCYLGLVVLVLALRAGVARRSLDAGLAVAARLGGRLLLVGAGAWAIMLAAWPWALLDPLRRPLITLARMSAYNEHRRRMPFAGEELWNDQIGWTYLPHYLAVQLPEVLLVLIVGGSLYLCAGLLSRGRDQRLAAALLAIVVLGLAGWFPPIYAILKGSVLYDGYRHFLFAVMPWTVIAALAVDRLAAAAIIRFGRRIWAVLVALLAALALDLGATMARLHPHEYVYFNRGVGGLAGAAGRYDTDYYGNSFKEALTGLGELLWRSERERYLRTVYIWSGCVSPRTGARYVPANFRAIGPGIAGGSPAEEALADFHVGYTRYHCDRRHARAPIIYTVTRFGVALNVARDLRDLHRGGGSLRLSAPIARPRRGRAAAIDPADSSDGGGDPGDELIRGDDGAAAGSIGDPP